MSKTTSADDGLAPSTAVASAGVAVASSSPQQGSTLQRDITAADGMVDAARRAELEALLTEKEALLQCRLVEHQRLQAENAALAQECRELRTKFNVNAQRDANYNERMAHHEARRSRLRSAAVTAVRASADQEEARCIKISADLAKTSARRTGTISTLEHDAKTAAASAQKAEEEAEKDKATAEVYKAAVQSNAVLVVGEAAKFCHRSARSQPRSYCGAPMPQRRRSPATHPRKGTRRVGSASQQRGRHCLSDETTTGCRALRF